MGIGQVLFLRFYGPRLGQYPAILTELAWSIKDLLYSIPRLLVALCFYFCVCQFLLQNVFSKLVNIFVFFVFILVDAFGFLVSSRQRHHRKSFYCHGKYLAVSFHLARSGSQSQRGIWFIFPAHRASHIIKFIISSVLLCMVHVFPWPVNFLQMC